MSLVFFFFFPLDIHHLYIYYAAVKPCGAIFLVVGLKIATLLLIILFLWPVVALFLIAILIGEGFQLIIQNIPFQKGKEETKRGKKYYIEEGAFLSAYS
jgi:hypothetical protein